MRSDEEYREILQLWEQGTPKKRIARLTGIPRGTVRDCINRYHNVTNLDAIRAEHPAAPYTLCQLQSCELVADIHLLECYAYLLGLYLGDGYINREPRTYKLRIFLATAYPNIIQTCIQAIHTLLPFNKVGVRQGQGNFVEVSCYNNCWPEFFPQHSSGPKHTRPIILETWQDRIVQCFPVELLRGLIHSDGCRRSLPRSVHRTQSLT